MERSSSKFAAVALLAAIFAGAVSSAPAAGEAYSLKDLTAYARPMCGTAADAFTFPGAVAPFGMIQWSPDTELGLRKGGYSDQDKRISDFSVDHISGAGCSYGEDFAMMPILGALPTQPPDLRSDFAAAFSHKHETATPGYYAVTFDNGLKVELTTTVRSGFGRFTWPRRATATMMINAASDINTSAASLINVNPATGEVSGQSTGGYFCNGRRRDRDIRTIYFYAVFDHSITAFSTWSNKTLTTGATNGAGTASGAYLTFDTSRGRTVMVKVGISYVSAANAKANVEAECPGFTAKDFDRAVKAAGEAWNERLNKIQVSGGSKADLETFYSMLYHTLQGPSVVSDANGEYMGYDGQVHTVEPGRRQYGIFSGWDIYRSECQLLAMIAPQAAGDMAQSLLMDYQQGGTFPRWGVVTDDSGTMMGDPAAAEIADFYTYGATNFNAQAALTGLVRAATDPSVHSPRSKTRERDALADYLKLGYVPEHQKGGYGNVSMTLEYDSADFALAQFAQEMGDGPDGDMLLEHAQNWRNHFNPESGYLQMRRRDGSWTPGFSAGAAVYDNDRGYVEGTPSQYVWMVPFNLKELAGKMGGLDAAAKRLDEFFTKLNGGFNSTYAYLGNEPCLETPWIYDFLGQPWKTQNIVRRAATELFSAADQGYPGNDDVGEMSSWYVFAALGMYPELPGSDVLVIGSPLFRKAVIHLPAGDVTIIGHGAAAKAPYVQSLTVNGKSSDKLWITYPEISRGGTLIYQLSPAANTNWGSAPDDAPPSYAGKM